MNPFKRNRKMKQNTEQIQEKQIIQTTTKIAEAPKAPIDPCKPPCNECLRGGCL